MTDDEIKAFVESALNQERGALQTKTGVSASGRRVIDAIVARLEQELATLDNDRSTKEVAS